MNKAFQDVMAERRRQIEAEGWTTEHDDQHADGELALAAALYAIPYQMPGLKQDDHIGLDMLLELGFDFKVKPEADYRKRLVKAGALLLAEIERLDRAAGIAVPANTDALTASIIPYANEDSTPDTGMAGLVMLSIGRDGEIPEHVLDRIPEAAAKVICGLLNAKAEG